MTTSRCDSCSLVLQGKSRSTQVEGPGRGCPDPGLGVRPPPLQDAEIYQPGVAHTGGTRVAWCYTAKAVPPRRQVTSAGVARRLTGLMPPPLQDSRDTPLPWIPPNGGGSMPQQVMRTNEPSVRGITGAQCRNALATRPTPSPARTGTRSKIRKVTRSIHRFGQLTWFKSQDRAPGKSNRFG